ncbi:conserved hypothetical protein [delta proteobacterium NaphS2]|nr:conserved hypothetical protein [delta proteobacterium NaphS2]
MSKRDLFVVVADLDAENAIKTLLTRRQKALGIALDFSPISPPNGDLLRYVGRDSGCRVNAVDLLRPPQKTHRHAMICFDRHGCGARNQSREEIEAEIERQLHINGWCHGDVAAIVIEPELESWVWADSAEVAHVMGWKGDMNAVRRSLISRGLLVEGEAKPKDPKAAMKYIISEKRNRRLTARMFAELAQNVSFHACEDPAFNKMRTILRGWFPT